MTRGTEDSLRTVVWVGICVTVLYLVPFKFLLFIGAAGFGMLLGGFLMLWLMGEISLTEKRKK